MALGSSCEIVRNEEMHRKPGLSSRDRTPELERRLSAPRKLLSSTHRVEGRNRRPQFILRPPRAHWHAWVPAHTNINM